MSLALELDVRRTRSVSALLASVWLAGMAGAAVTCLYLVQQSQFLLAGLLIALAGGGLPAAVVAARARLAHGRLAVDEQGRASWSGPEGVPATHAVIPVRWFAGATVVWIRINPCSRPAARYDLLLGRDGTSDEQWRRLRAWLLWLERSGSS